MRLQDIREFSGSIQDVLAMVPTASKIAWKTSEDVQCFLQNLASIHPQIRIDGLLLSVDLAEMADDRFQKIEERTALLREKLIETFDRLDHPISDDVQGRLFELFMKMEIVRLNLEHAKIMAAMEPKGPLHMPAALIDARRELNLIALDIQRDIFCLLHYDDELHEVPTWFQSQFSRMPSSIHMNHDVEAYI